MSRLPLRRGGNVRQSGGRQRGRIARDATSLLASPAGACWCVMGWDHWTQRTAPPSYGLGEPLSRHTIRMAPRRRLPSIGGRPEGTVAASPGWLGDAAAFLTGRNRSVRGRDRGVMSAHSALIGRRYPPPKRTLPVSAVEAGRRYPPPRRTLPVSAVEIGQRPRRRSWHETTLSSPCLEAHANGTRAVSKRLTALADRLHSRV